MKPVARHLLLIVLLACSASLCAAQEDKPSGAPPPVAVESNDGEWKEFLSPEGDFSVSMPGTPQSTPMEVDSSPGKISYQAFGLKTTNAAYMIIYSDVKIYSEKPEILKRALDVSLERLLSENDGTVLLSEKEITIDGLPAREWLYEYRGLITKQRVVMVKDRLYHVIFAALPNTAFKSGRPSANPDEQTEFYAATAKKFFESFKTMPRRNIAGRSIDTMPAPNAVKPDGAPKTGTGTGSGTAAEGEVDKMLREGKAGTIIGASTETAQNIPTLNTDPIISGGVLTGKLTDKPQPVYPPIAKSARASGPVTVKIIVDEEGKVIAAQAESGHPLLRAAAVQAARKARFDPTTLDGKPVKILGTITYYFALTADVD